jgi:hypothetical protein
MAAAIGVFSLRSRKRPQSSLQKSGRLARAVRAHDETFTSAKISMFPVSSQSGSRKISRNGVVPVGSVRVCTGKFCANFSKELGLNDFQVNTLFPAGPGRRSKDAFTSTTQRTREVSFRWIPKERRALRLLGYQLSRRSFWHIFREPYLTGMLRENPARREFVEGPKHLVEHADRLSRAYLPMALSRANLQRSVRCWRRIRIAKFTKLFSAALRSSLGKSCAVGCWLATLIGRHVASSRSHGLRYDGDVGQK